MAVSLFKGYSVWPCQKRVSQCLNNGTVCVLRCSGESVFPYPEQEVER
jgi:hypothetical protein